MKAHQNELDRHWKTMHGCSFSNTAKHLPLLDLHGALVESESEHLLDCCSFALGEYELLSWRSVECGQAMRYQVPNFANTRPPAAKNVLQNF